MSEFDIIESGFDAANETINFGRRSLGDNTNLYEIVTLAVLRSSDEDKKIEHTNVKGLVRNKVYLALDESVRVFADKTCTEVVFYSLFDSIIDTICVSTDERFLLICLASGMVHLVDQTSNTQENATVFSELIEEHNGESTLFINSFVESSSNESVSFLVVSQTGTIYKIIVLLESLTVSSGKVFETHSYITQVAFSYPILMATGDKFFAINIEEKSSIHAELSTRIIRIFPFKNSNTFLALNEAGNLLKLCSRSLLIYEITTETTYKDISVIRDREKTHILSLTIPTELNPLFIQLLSCPKFTPNFSLKHPHQIELIQLDNITDEILFLSKVIRGNYIEEVRVSMVYETEPTKRLERLVKQLKFDEAEKFAENFNINRMIIHKTKAQMFFEKSVCDKEDVDALLELLEKIDDDEFRMKTCMQAHEICGCGEDVRRILTYGCKFSGSALNIGQSLQKTLFRFDTFMILNDTYDIKEWARFSGCDLLVELNDCLKHYQVDKAINIYNRLDEESIVCLTDSYIIEHILLILNNLPFEVCEPFLPSFIRSTLIRRPTTLSIFVNWLEEQIYKMEKHDSDNFPRCAIEFTENMFKLLKVGGGKNVTLQFSVNHECLNRLNPILKGLNGLEMLKNTYFINVSLSEYLKEPKELVKVLLRVTSRHPNQFEDFLSSFLCNFMQQNQLDHNQIFLNEIKCLTKNVERYWVDIIGPILKCISSTLSKLEAVEIILTSSNVPWCEKVRNIAHSVLHYSHPRVEVIKRILEDEKRLIVLQRPYYNFRKTLKSKQIGVLMIHIRYVNQSTMIEDIYNLCRTDADRHTGSKILMLNFVEKGLYKDALAILENNSQKEIAKLITEFISLASVVINSQYSSQKHYYNVLISSQNHLLVNTYKNSVYDSEYLQIMRNTYNINNYFNTKVSISDLQQANQLAKVYNSILEETVSNVLSAEISIPEIFKVCEKIACYLRMKKEDVVVRLCEKLGNIDVVLEAAKQLHQDETTSSRNLYLGALLILKYIGTNNALSLNDTFNAEPDMDRDDLSEGLMLAEDLAVQALVKAKVNDYHMCCELMNWIDCYSYLTDRNKLKTLERYEPRSSSFAKYPTFNAAKHVFEMYCRFVGQFRNESTIFITDLYNKAPLTEDALLKEVQKLSHMIDNMNKNGQLITAYKLIVKLRNSLFFCPVTNHNIMSNLNSLLLKKCIPLLLQVLVAEPKIDTALFYHILENLDKETILSYLEHFMKQIKRHPEKLSALAVVGLKLTEIGVINQDPFVDCILGVKWWNKIKNGRIPYDTFFKAKPNGRLEFMIKCGYINEEILLEYCVDFKLDVQVYYQVYLRQILLNFKPDYEIQVDLAGKRCLLVKATENELFGKCKSIVKRIEDKTNLLRILTEIWNEVNFYYYEVFSCIILLRQFLRNFDADQYTMVLTILKMYQRIKPPNQDEMTKWYSRFVDKTTLDPLSEFRLPFKQDLCADNIKPEIHLKTYKTWLGAMGVLNDSHLNKDKICTIAIKDVIASGILGKNQNNQEWCLYPKHEELFREIDECAANISSLELCTSVLYHVMTQTPKGADQVSATALCYKYAKLYREQNPGNPDVEKSCLKVEIKYYSLTAMHILYTFELNNEKYLELVTQPENLIIALYLDDRIVKTSNSLNSKCPDINGAAVALEKLFDLHLQKIQYQLVNNWLSVDLVCDLDSPLLMMHSIQSKNEDNNNLKRIVYICAGTDREFWGKYLLKIGLEDGKDTSSNAKALWCFHCINDEDTIKECTQMSPGELLYYIDKLYLVSEINNFGIEMDIASFDNYNKKDLVKRLAKYRNSSSIKLMANVCMNYNIMEIKYWEFIINNAIKLQMYDDLKVYVDFLSQQYNYHDFYIKAWQAIVNNITNHLEFDSFLTIQSCPVLYSINFDKLFNYCLEGERYSFAAVFLQFLPETENKKNNAKRILDSCKTIYEDLDSFSRKGVCGLSKVQTYLKRSDVN